MLTQVQTRMVGAIALVALAVIILPVLFEGKPETSSSEAMTIAAKIPPTPPEPQAAQVMTIQDSTLLSAKQISEAPSDNAEDANAVSFAEAATKTSSEAEVGPLAEATQPMKNASAATAAAGEAGPFGEAAQSAEATAAMATVKSATAASLPVQPAAVQVQATKSIVSVKQAPQTVRVQASTVKAVANKLTAQTSVAAKTARFTAKPGWSIQVGSFNTRTRALMLQSKLQKAGYPAYLSTGTNMRHQRITRVLIGPEVRRTAAQQVMEQLERHLQMKSIIVYFEPTRP